jgi:hypothetical protein
MLTSEVTNVTKSMKEVLRRVLKTRNPIRTSIFLSRIEKKLSRSVYGDSRTLNTEKRKRLISIEKPMS